jgi:hypothetical protein
VNTGILTFLSELRGEDCSGEELHRSDRPGNNQYALHGI